ncbi:hypothetical protein PHMEG_00017878 [Phytophthora megakarya]|uniref:Uncharacterized protein n=1 Tax=Phytophthora megakarya TaxID=4795 RepID=A0A225VVG8_9STRA|nr:hypothetical protein PHMEG_00017878 [Phytophthora megakarya]
MGVSRRKDDDNQPEMSLRLVVLTTMIQEQRVKHDYYWIGLYADGKKHMKSCLDYSSSKSLPQLKGYSPGNVLAERPFQVVAMAFVIPLPRPVEGTLSYCYGSARLLGS